jgi:hypothetical protein
MDDIKGLRLPSPARYQIYMWICQASITGYEFTEGAELVSAISENLNQIPSDTLVNVFDDWIRRSQRCIDMDGEYVE